MRGYSWGEVRANIAAGIYYDELRKWLQFYPRKNFLFLSTNDLASDPVGVMKNITTFLELDPGSDKDVHQWFSVKKNSRSKTFLSREFDMMPDTKRLLHDFYSPYNDRLVELIDDKRFVWTHSYNTELHQTECNTL